MGLGCVKMSMSPGHLQRCLTNFRPLTNITSVYHGVDICWGSGMERESRSDTHHFQQSLFTELHENHYVKPTLNGFPDICVFTLVCNNRQAKYNCVDVFQCFDIVLYQTKHDCSFGDNSNTNFSTQYVPDSWADMTPYHPFTWNSDM